MMTKISTLQSTVIIFFCLVAFNIDLRPIYCLPSIQPIELGLWQNGIPLQTDQRQYIDKTELISAFVPPPIPPQRPPTKTEMMLQPGDKTNTSTIVSPSSSDDTNSEFQFVIKQLTESTKSNGHINNTSTNTNNNNNNKTQLEYKLLKKAIQSN